MGPASRPPVAVRVIRPHQSLEEFYATDLGTITTSTIVLLGAQRRPEGIVLRFEVVLSDGTPIIRGEGRVIGYMDRTPLGEPGLCLKLIRVDPRSKEVLDEALFRKDQAGIARGRESVPPTVASIPPPSDPPPAGGEEVPVSLPPHSASPRKAPPPLPTKRSAPPPLKSKTKSAPPSDTDGPDTPIELGNRYPSEPTFAVNVTDLVMLEDKGSVPPPASDAENTMPETVAPVEAAAALTPPINQEERNQRLERLRARYRDMSPEARAAIAFGTSERNP